MPHQARLPTRRLARPHMGRRRLRISISHEIRCPYAQFKRPPHVVTEALCRSRTEFFLQSAERSDHCGSVNHCSWLEFYQRPDVVHSEHFRVDARAREELSKAI